MRGRTLIALAVTAMAVGAIGISPASATDVCGFSFPVCPDPPPPDPAPTPPPPPPPAPQPPPAPPPPPPPSNYDDVIETSGNDTLYLNSSLSGSGCRTVNAHRKAVSFLFRTTVWKLNLMVSYCWVYPKIISVGSVCNWTDVNGPWFVDPCTTSASWISWQGSAQGARYIQAQGHAENCIAFKWGCFKSKDPLVKVWIVGNGSYKIETSG